MISPATIRRRVTEKIMKRRPVMALVKSSLPFLTASALSPPVMIWTVATNMMTSEIAPAVPARNVRSSTVKPRVSTLKQPRAVSIAVAPQLPFGSMARAKGGKARVSTEERERKYGRIEICFLSGDELVIA